MSLIEELKRRNVFRVGIAYLVAAWLLLQVIDFVGPIVGLSDDLARYLLFLLAIGLFPVLILAWIFELTPEGVKRESEIDRSVSITSKPAKKLDRGIIVVLLIAVGLLLFDKLALQRKNPGLAGEGHSIADTTGNTSVPGVKPGHPETPAWLAANSVAVLPFLAMSNGPDDDYFSDGLTEEIINALTQLPELLVTARTSAFHFKGQNLPVEDIARELGVDHIVEGSVRRAGDRLRITAQLVRASDGFHLWSETYDRRTEDTFGVLSDIAEKVASALNVFLDDNLLSRMQAARTRNVEAFIALQKGIALYERAHQEANQISLLRQANVEFDTAIQLAPELVEAYHYHSDLSSYILISHAAGQLDGEITQADLLHAPTALKIDYDRAIRYAKNAGQRFNAEYDRALILGAWRGLKRLSDQSLATYGCETALWAHLVGAPFGETQLALDAFSRMAACDPLRIRSLVHIASSQLWLGAPALAIRSARKSLKKTDHPLLSRSLVLALAFNGDLEEAEKEANSRIRVASELALVQAMLAVIRGDIESAQNFESQYIGISGPNDLETLVLEAAQGNRNEANRLAALIDSRPFGHVVLMQAIHSCLCGAPFDLDAAPAFAAMLSGSGLDWPPGKPFDFPLKDW